MSSPTPTPVHYYVSWIQSLINDPKVENPKVIKKEIHTENQTYSIIRYDKSLLSYDSIDIYGLLRSVILDKNRQLVSFSPPKSVPAELFLQNYPDVLSPGIVAEEFVEGTMINVFWDTTIGLSGAWEIATRNSVGANISFYQEFDKQGLPKAKTFRQMFLEAMDKCQLTFDHLQKGCCYSFVLQHPENRIVVPFKKPDLYLVAVYHCITEEKEVLVYPMNIAYLKNNTPLKNTLVKYPKKYQEKTYTDLIQKYASMNTPYHIMGLNIWNQYTGERCKIRNPVYEKVRQLKGNQAKLQFHYLSLRKSGKINEYLTYYPEHKKEFSSFREEVHLFTQTLYENYVSCFIKKMDPNVYNYPKEYQSCMKDLHQQFLTSLRENKQGITYPYVINYVNELPPAKLMYLINTPLRERKIEMDKKEQQ
jgi:hypothetical protein